MKVSIVIPAFNEERLLGQSLDHVNRARVAFANCGWESELIVCDNNSTDQTAKIALAAGATVVFEPVNQIGRARNRGAAAATGDWLVFVDADSHPSAELFADVAEQIQAGKCLAGGSTVRLEAGYPVGNLVTGLWNGISRWRCWLAGSFIFCETTAFRKIAGFSNELFAGEELDLSQRLHALAKETNRTIVVLHRHPLHTSARKMRLYSVREHLGFLLRVLIRPVGAIRNRDACNIWYDGRR